MKSRNSISLTVFLMIATFAVAGVALAQQRTPLQMMMAGGEQMMNGNKMIMAKMEKKGMKDPKMESAQKMMAEGYGMMTNAKSMMATNKAEAQKMASKGAKMMLDAQNLASVECNTKGMAKDCGMELTQCKAAAEKIKQGALQWFFGGAGI